MRELWMSVKVIERYDNKPDRYRDAKFTGRWKIRTVDGYDELHIECWRMTTEWFHTIRLEYWVHESNLQVVQETINECGS